MEEPTHEVSGDEAKIITESYQGKCCPLTLKAVAAPPPVLSGVGRSLGVSSEPEPEALGCQGPNCMWFRIIQEPSGKVVGGECAATLIAKGLAQLPIGLGNVFAQLSALQNSHSKRG